MKRTKKTNGMKIQETPGGTWWNMYNGKDRRKRRRIERAIRKQQTRREVDAYR